MSTAQNFDISNAVSWQIEQSKGFIYILNNRNKKYYMLDDIGKDIWLQLNDHRHFDEIIITLEKKCKVDKMDLIQDVNAFLQNMLSEGLISIS